MALVNEYLPPTQSQKMNIFSASIPKSVTAFSFVDNAIKCFATYLLSFAEFKNQSLAEKALVMVSCVVKVFDATRNNVSSGSSFFSVSTKWLASIFETK